MRKLIFGKHYTGLVKVPFMNCNRFRMHFSTRNNNIIIKGLDGVITNYTTPKNYDFTSNSNPMPIIQITTSTTYSGDLEITTLGGNSDVYSIGYSWANSAGNDRFNIQDLGLFYEQFPNLYSIHYEIYAYNDTLRQPTFKGNLIKFGNSVRRCSVSSLDILNRTSNAYVNLNEINSNSQLEWFYHHSGYAVNYSGDLAKLPPNIYYFVAGALNTSTLTYTAGRVWASSFDTLNLGNAKLSVTDTDNLFIDLNNSITTAIGSKVINLANCFRTSISDTAVAGLQAKGYTVTVLGVVINDLTNLLYINNIAKTVTMNGQVFNITDHKGGNTAIKFGSGNLVSVDNLPASPVWSVSFWMKYSSTVLINQNIVEISSNPDGKNSLIVRANQFQVGRIVGVNSSTGNNYNVYGNNGYNDGQWHHIVVILDRSKSASNEIIIYKDKVLQTLTSNISFDSIGNFISDKLYIGARGDTYTNPFIGATSPIKMFNYPLIQTEIDNLYNE